MRTENHRLGPIHLTLTMSLGATAAQVVVVALLVLGLPALGAAVSLSCGDSVGPGGAVIQVSNDLLACGASPALTVTGPVTLDLKGHAIGCTGSGPDGRGTGPGILLLGSGAVLKNGRVFNCEVAVDVAGTGGHVVQHMLSFGGSFRVSSDGNELSGNALSAASTLLAFLISGSNNRLEANTVESSGFAFGFAVFATTSTGNEFQGNAVVGGLGGFLLAGTQHRLVQNTAIGNNQEGFVLFGDQFVVQANTAMGNLAEGFAVVGSGHLMQENQAFVNGVGILVDSLAQNNTLQRNVALGSTSLFDLKDNNPGCDANSWKKNVFHVSNAPCIH